MQICDLVLRRVSPMGGPMIDIGVRAGMVVAIGEKLQAKGPEIDGRGGVVLPGLIDHHIHLLATAARISSVDLSGLTTEKAVVEKLSRSAAIDDSKVPMRAIGYDERAAGLPDIIQLTEWVVDRPLRIQDRTGALWLLNKPMFERLGSGLFPECVERDSGGDPTGRIWRGDAWLRERLGSEVPPVGLLGRELAKLGITGVTDAGPDNGVSEGRLFNALRQSGDLPQKLQLMGNEQLPISDCYEQGPLKLHYDERNLPPFEEIVERIECARTQNRSVAAHCVTDGELVFFLAALDASGGAMRGDRIEHGGIISEAMIGEIAARHLTVVSQPGFIHERGQRYAETVEARELDDIYRLRSLAAAGIAMAAGSDGPYGSLDPWLAMRSARDRCTPSGQAIGAKETLDVAKALELYLQPFDLSHNGIRTIEVGAEADLCLLEGGWQEIIDDPHAEAVQATIIGGEVVYLRS